MTSAPTRPEDITFHDVDSFYGRPHRHKQNGTTVWLRPLTRLDVKSSSYLRGGRPDEDYRMQTSYQSDDHQVLPAAGYAHYEPIPIGPHELMLRHLFAWLGNQLPPITMVSSVDWHYRHDAYGAYLSLITDPRRPAEVLVRVAVREKFDKEDELRRLVKGKLVAGLGMSNPQEVHGDLWFRATEMYERFYNR